MMQVLDSCELCMNTVITQKVIGNNAEKAMRDCSDELKRLEAMLTFFSEDSDIARINRSAGESFVAISADTLKVLSAAKEFSSVSGGAFDITMAPIIRCWNVNSPEHRIPEQAEIADLLKLVDSNDLVVNEANRSAYLKRKGQMIDLGGIAKGYAADRAKAIYLENGIESAFINLGGNVLVIGGKPDGSPWRVGIQDPRGAMNSFIGVLSLKNKTVVTSGDYQRYFMKGDKRYHHILDPRTGYPSNSGIIGATIVADVSMDADALSTAAFVMGIDAALNMLTKYEGVEAVLVTEDKKIVITKGLRDLFTPVDSSSIKIFIE